jgi:hypothetical protein
MEVFFFQKKKQKALFRFAEGFRYPNLGEADQGVWGLAPKKTIKGLVFAYNWSSSFFFFKKKKQKALFCFAEVYVLGVRDLSLRTQLFLRGRILCRREAVLYP